MFHSLIRQIDQFLGTGRASSHSPRARRTSLGVEALEARWVPSTSAVESVVAVPIAPASETGGSIPVTPDAVHGYKWRRPRWPIPVTFDAPGGDTGAVVKSRAPQEIVSDVAPAQPADPLDDGPRGKLHGVRHHKPFESQPDLGLDLFPMPLADKEPVAPETSALPDLVGVTLYWTPDGPVTGQLPGQWATHADSGRMGYLKIESEDLSSGRFTGTCVYFDDHFWPVTVPVVGVVSSSASVSADGGRTYDLAFTSSAGDPVAFTGTVSVYPGNIGISGEFSAGGVTGHDSGSEIPIAFILYSQDSVGILPTPPMQAHASDAFFSTLGPHPLMAVKK